MDRTDLWKNGRYERYEFVEVIGGNDVGVLLGITGGKITRNYLSELKYSASVNYSGVVNEGWIDKTLRVYLVATAKWDANVSERILLGTFRTTTPKRKIESNTSSYTIEGYSNLILLRNKKVAGTMSFAAGSNTVANVVALCQSVGLNTRDIASSHVLSTPYTSEKGATYLSICNDLLSMANYSGVGVDEFGNAVIAPYVAAGDKSPSWVFADDEDGVY